MKCFVLFGYGYYIQDFVKEMLFWFLKMVMNFFFVDDKLEPALLKFFPDFVSITRVLPLYVLFIK